jgi:hypothetical protein
MRVCVSQSKSFLNPALVKCLSVLTALAILNSFIRIKEEASTNEYPWSICLNEIIT